MANGTQEYAYPGQDEPRCLALVAGTYQVRVRLRDAMGPTTPTQLAALLTRGSRIDLLFGGAADYQPPTPPPDMNIGAESLDTGIAAPSAQREVKAKTEETTFDKLYQRSGLIVLALAGVLAMGSVFFLVFLNRPRFD